MLIVSFVMVLIVAGAWQLFQPSGRAPDFTLTDMNASIVRLSAYNGKVVLIDFMATWCGPCRTSVLGLKEIWKTYAHQIVMISISVDPAYDSISVLASWVNLYNVTWTHARDTSSPPVAQLYKVENIPTFIIIDKKGEIRYRHEGITEGWKEKLLEEVSELLKE